MRMDFFGFVECQCHDLLLPHCLPSANRNLLLALNTTPFVLIESSLCLVVCFVTCCYVESKRCHGYLRISGSIGNNYNQVIEKNGVESFSTYSLRISSNCLVFRSISLRAVTNKLFPFFRIVSITPSCSTLTDVSLSIVALASANFSFNSAIFSFSFTCDQFDGFNALFNKWFIIKMEKI